MQTKVFFIHFNQFSVPGADMIDCPGKHWSSLYPGTDNGLSKWALRSLLVKTANSLILFDTGFGNKQPASFFEPFQLEGDFLPDRQLQQYGFTRNDITDVVLTHLHYDHCGGCLLNEKGNIVRTYPRAQLWISARQWQNALNPLEKEKESFLPENFQALPDLYPVRFIEEEGSILPGTYFRLVDGHTAGQIIPLIRLGSQNILFGADLFPSSVHLDPQINMVYDIDPHQAIREKSEMLEECINNRWIIIFQHGTDMTACTVSLVNNEKVIYPVNLSSLT
jgi:glyoxylase-like metal-dependent hydrolase (beta-lactamase superfamily II)